jgi:hypothetical protein
MKFKSLYRYLLVAGVLLTAAASCKKDPNNPGTEYAPNMYLPVGYEPYKQEKANPINPGIDNAFAGCRYSGKKKLQNFFW